jgi:acyl-coenzyme A thioesterase PaaI-like protein
VWERELTATGEVVTSGRTVGVVECDVRDEDGSLVARLRSTCLKLSGDAASGR